ncbi:hypothetical protein [Actinocrispum sp. NPDC049592]
MLGNNKTLAELCADAVKASEERDSEALGRRTTRSPGGWAARMPLR